MFIANYNMTITFKRKKRTDLFATLVGCNLKLEIQSDR